MRSWLRPNNSKRIVFFIATDIFFSIITLYFAYLLRFNFDIPMIFLEPIGLVALVLITLKLIFIAFFGNYRIIWRYYALSDAKNLFMALVGSYLLFAVVLILSPTLFAPFPRSVIVIDLFLSFVILGGIRLLKRLVLGYGALHRDVKPTLLVGVSIQTPNLIRSLIDTNSEYYPINIIAIQEKNRNMIGSTLNNLKIIGKDNLKEVIFNQNIHSAIIDGSLPNELLREVYKELSSLGITDIKRSALLADGEEKITSLSVEELLARHPKDLNTDMIQHFIHQKVVLITGAGGSIGSEITLQCKHFGASKLILIDHSEYNLYQIGEKLPDAVLRLCNITDYLALDEIMSTSTPDIVIHAAAYKHVPLCEANAHIAIENNILGSRNVINSAIEHNVSKIVIISTDKAVRPTNVMGATKRVVELYAQNVDPRNSEIVAVRFGNVLGSSGSVIPKFKAQIEAGGPVTITHPDVTRYFMLIDEACQLVLQAASIARGGELFILDMGESVKIVDLAETMIRLYATRPIEIIATGLRPGEKLYEELLLDESEQKTSFESIMIAGRTIYPIDRLNQQIDVLLQSDNPKEALKEIVTEYTPF